MKVAALERFSCPSRRCDPCHVDVGSSSLPQIAGRGSPARAAGPGRLVRHGRRSSEIAGGCSAPASAPAARQFGALLRAPELLGRVQTTGRLTRSRSTRARTSLWRTFWRVDWTAVATKLSPTAPNTSASSPSSCSRSSPMRTGCTRGACSSARSPPPTPGRFITSPPITRSGRSRAGTCRSPSIPSAAADCSVTTQRVSEGTRHPSLAAASLQGGVRQQPVRLGPRVMHHLQQVLRRAVPMVSRPRQLHRQRHIVRSHRPTPHPLPGRLRAAPRGRHRERPPDHWESWGHRGGGAEPFRTSGLSSSSMPSIPT